MVTDTVEASAVTVNGRFCGSPNIASGGYIAGLLGRLMDGPARVSLEQPVPVDHRLGIERLGDGGLALTDGPVTFAHASAAPLQLEPPAPVTYADAEWASERYLGFTEHATPGCFVCGPAREWGDGLAIYPGPIPGRRLVAAPWAPDPTLFDKHGVVRPEFVWAALDCPIGFALLEAFGRRKLVLSHLTASLIRPLPVGARWIVMGWPFAAEGRTLLGASAIFSESGELHALASAVLVRAD
ncbi:MAG TPA: hypothetical protein VFO08_06465 [Methylomirabilota bacterium]|nr:hypothetical protein [Methylomirabilota bacterium]